MMPDFHANRCISEEVLAAMYEMNCRDLPATPGREEALELLRTGPCSVVVSGQQAGLFLGPAFTLYKIVSALRTAEEIEARTKTPAVTVFWMQNEDHDLEEIASTAIPSRTGELIRLSLNLNNSRRRSVAYESLPKHVTALLDRAADELGHHPAAIEMLARFRAAYRPGYGFSAAFIQLAGSLFSDRRVLFFNPRRPEICRLARPVFSKALAGYAEIEDLLRRKAKKLRGAGRKEQVHVRARSPLFFLHEGAPDGPRRRLTREGAHWAVVGGDRAVEDRELDRIVEEYPEQLSCTALLRPILQDYLLPTTCYIAGDAELRYFEQIEPLYQFFGITQPTALPRASFRIVEARERELLEGLSLRPEHLELSADELASLLALKSELRAPDELFAEVSAQMAVAYGILVPEFERADRTLLDPLTRTRTKALGSLEGLKNRYTEALARGDATSSTRMARLRNMLRPDGEEQERVFGGLYYLLRYGEPFLSRIEAEVEPFVKTKKDIYL